MKRVVCLLLLVLILAGCGKTAAPTETTAPAVPVELDIAQVATETQNIQYYFMTSDGTVIDGNDKYHTKWGDSCLIAFPDGKIMLIDTGMKSFYPLLKEKLQKLGVSKIDYMVFTHPHNDHAGGLWTTLFEDFQIDHVYHNGEKNANWEKSAPGRHVEDICAKYNVPATVWEAGNTMDFGNAENPVKMQVLWPTKEAKEELSPIASSASINCLSLVLRFDYGEHSSLFTGDLYKTRQELKEVGDEQIPGHEGAEERLVALYTNGELDVDLLKLPHHGDPSTSNSESFLTAVDPEFAVATSFNPVGDYMSTYKKRGMNAIVFYDRMYGFCHIQSGTDGKIVCKTSRATYPEGFTGKWNSWEKMSNNEPIPENIFISKYE